VSKEQKECKDFKDNIGGLTNRLNINNRYGNNDLKPWLIEHLNIKSDDDILDIGCGDGRHLSDICKLTNGDCWGIDYDGKMIEKSNSSLTDKEDNIQYHQFSMDDINTSLSPLGDNRFDLIYSLYAFYYSKDSIALLDLLKNRLEENGRISITGPYGENNKNWFDFLNQFIELDESIINSSYSFMGDVLEYANNNFSSVTTNDFVNTITLPTYADLKKYWESNIYYDSKYDDKFEELAKHHFTLFHEFSYNKVAKMITMGGKNG
jgi:SAM-dependent methyltransferase|tara:strand:+ start:738 stop:1529 length:792 start_codon:yes stop_codon:yes gene_type:complete